MSASGPRLGRLPAPLVQAAGVLDSRDADVLLDAGFDTIGFPLSLDVHPEDVPATVAADLAARIATGRRAEPLVITYLVRPSEILDLVDRVGVSLVQLHGDVPALSLAELVALRPGLRVVKSLVVGRRSVEELLEEARRSTPWVDAFLTDTFDPTTGASGATGKAHDWETSRRLVDATERPVILAGGLGPLNVREAIQAVHPAGVDVHTGIEAPDGHKDPHLAQEFVRIAREALGGPS